MKIDTHLHLGECGVFNMESTEEELLNAMKENGLDKIIVQPFPGPRNCTEAHKQVAQMVAKYSSKVYGIVSLNPHDYTAEEYEKEAAKWIRDYGFVALKLHTIGHAISPTSPGATKIFEAARKLSVPVMIHTGTGIPFALPSMVLPRAKQFPDVTMILSHAGYCVYAQEALIVAQECSNVILEPSWTQPQNIKGMIKTLGAKRVMMGSDAVINIPVELAKIKAMKLNKEEEDYYTAKTAINVFKL